ENQSEVFLHRVPRHADLWREGFRFGWLLNASARAIVFPTVIETADKVALDPPGGELRAAVGAAMADQMRRAALTAVERKLFIHDPNRQRLANRKLMGATNRLPEHPQVTPGQSSRSGVNEFVKIHRRRHHSLSRPGLSSDRAKVPENALCSSRNFGS